MIPGTTACLRGRTPYPGEQAEVLEHEYTKKISDALKRKLRASDKQFMDYTSLATKLRGWKTDIRRTLDTGRSESAPAGSPEWYAGLAVSPASFSRQLGDMQTAMLRANSKRTNDASAGAKAVARAQV